MGFEPTTFPVLPGRAHKSLYEFAILLAFDIELPSDGLASRVVLLRVDQPPGAPVLQREGIVRIVIGETFLKVFRLSDVIPIRGFALEDVHIERHDSKLVELMGFEPTTSS